MLLLTFLIFKKSKTISSSGSSSGIGQEAAIAFAREGAKLVIHGRDEARLEVSYST